MAKTQGYYPIRVAPFTGARIETERGEILLHDRAVAPFTGARIETVSAARSGETLLSLPSRERGLKHER